MFRAARAFFARCAAGLRGKRTARGSSVQQPEQLVITPMPSLVSLLLRAEDEKGSPLTREEVQAIRNKCVCIVLRGSSVAAIADRRGYDDIDPEHAWEDWQIAREQLRDRGASPQDDTP